MLYHNTHITNLNPNVNLHGILVECGGGGPGSEGLDSEVVFWRWGSLGHLVGLRRLESTWLSIP